MQRAAVSRTPVIEEEGPGKGVVPHPQPVRTIPKFNSVYDGSDISYAERLMMLQSKLRSNAKGVVGGVWRELSTSQETRPGPSRK